MKTAHLITGCRLPYKQKDPIDDRISQEMANRGLSDSNFVNEWPVEGTLTQIFAKTVQIGSIWSIICLNKVTIMNLIKFNHILEYIMDSMSQADAVYVDFNKGVQDAPF